MMVVPPKAPASHLFRLKAPWEPGSPMYTSGLDFASALEIGAGSEVDRVAVKHGDGTSVVAVGAPAVGPFRGPFSFMAFGGAFPMTTLSGTTIAWPATTLNRLPPLVHVVHHFQNPLIMATKRAPMERRTHVATLTAAYDGTPQFAFPVYGRRVAMIHLHTTFVGAETYSLKIGAFQFWQAAGASSTHADAQTDAWSLATAANNFNFFSAERFLALDSTGAIELTGLARSVPLTIVDEPCHVIGVFLKSADGITVQASCQAFD